MSATPATGSKPASALAGYLKDPRIQKALIGAGIGGLGLSSLSALSGNTAANSALYGLLGAGLGGGIGANANEIEQTFNDVTSAGDDNPLANLPAKAGKGILAGGAGALPGGLAAAKLYNVAQNAKLDRLSKGLADIAKTPGLSPDQIKLRTDAASEKMKQIMQGRGRTGIIGMALSPAIIAAALGDNDAALRIGEYGVGGAAVGAGGHGLGYLLSKISPTAGGIRGAARSAGNFTRSRSTGTTAAALAALASLYGAYNETQR